MPLQDLAGRVAAMKAAAKADAADAEPEPVPQYDALLAEEVSRFCTGSIYALSLIVLLLVAQGLTHRIMRSATLLC